MSNLKKVDGKYFLGAREVFENQVECSERLFKNLCINKLHKTVFLCAETQSGKTDTANITIDKFYTWTSDMGFKNVQVINSVNSASNNLLDQTQDRLKECDLENVKSLHFSRYGKFLEEEYDFSADATLLIVDEAHRALSGKERAPFNKFLKFIGVDLTKTRDQWTNQNIYILLISATPQSFVLRNMIDGYEKECFHFEYLHPGPNYLSLQDMYDQNRIIQSVKLFDKHGEPTKHCHNYFDEFFEQSKDKFSIFIIRLSGAQNQDNLKQFLSRHYPDKYSLEFYKCTNKNLDNFSRHLQMERTKPLIAVISGSNREGITFPTTKYIGMVYETPSSQSAAVTQALAGRCTGYPTKDGHNKRSDTFKIYCDESSVGPALAQSREMKNNQRPTVAASSTWNEGTQFSQRYKYKAEILEKNEANDLLFKKMNEESTANFEKLFQEQLKEDYDLRIIHAKFSGTFEEFVSKQKSNEEKLKTQTALQTKAQNGKGTLIDNLITRFSAGKYDDEKNVWYLTSQTQVGRYLKYEIINGCNKGYENQYKELMDILNLNNEKHYYILYSKEEYVEISSDVNENKFKKDCLLQRQD